MSTYETRKQAQKAFYALNQSISSDDPDALMKLRAKRDFLEEERQDMKRLNAAYRKGGWAAVPELDDKTVALLKQAMDRAPYQYQGRLFPQWEISNLGAQIRQVKGRINELEKRQAYVPAEPVFKAGCRIVENADDNRIHLEFDSKPDESVRNILKRHGFRWSPNRLAWVGMLNHQGRYAAKEAMCAIESLSSPAAE